MTQQNGKGPTRGALLAQQLRERRMAETSVEQPNTPQETALAGRARSAAFLGNKAQVIALQHLDPALCVPSPENARRYSDLTYDNCKDLIDSILSEGAQRFPATVRETGNPQAPYEIIAGSRRHFAISWLRANNYPEFTYLAQVQELEDEQSFRLSDLENRARQDISARERAEAYKRALERYYDGNVKAMSERLRISPPNLYRYLAIAEINSAIFDAFASPNDFKMTHVDALVKLWNGGAAQRSKIEAEAENIRIEQLALKAKGDKPISANDVLKRLVAATKEKGGRSAKTPNIAKSKSGLTLFSWSPPRGRAGLSITIPADKNLSRSELKAALSALIDEALPKAKD